MAAGRQERETVGDGPFQLEPSATKQCPVPLIEAELATVRAYEIENRANGLAWSEPQTAAQLLQKQCGALGGP
jgi:hypothetical protein